MPDLHASLDFPLPKSIRVGRGTALFVAGTCFCPGGRIESLELVVDGDPQPVMAHGMPRLDFFAQLHPRFDPYATGSLERDPDSREDPLLQAYASGFWGIARLQPDAALTDRVISLRAQLSDGSPVEAELARITVQSARERPQSPVWPRGEGLPRVAICMATYNPPEGLLRRQLDSIRAQTHENWVCFVSDDCSSPAAFAAIERELDGDARFVLSRSTRRRGFFGNFERALAMAPPDSDYVAMADQDDLWHPDKLDVLLREIGAAQLIYSDARIVSPDGSVIADSYWSSRRNNHSDMLSLLVANSVTGAASMLRREVLEYALPFPPAQFAHFHDHWVALVALSLGDISFVERPLYDYVQHGRASLGHATATRMTSLPERLRRQRPARERVRMWRLNYFVDACRLMQMASILLTRCENRMSPRKRRALHRFLAAEASVAPVALLAARGARELIGRPETLGAEWMLAHAFLWRRLLGISARERPQRRLRLDAVPPPNLALAPAREGRGESTNQLGDKIEPLDLAISSAAPRRINVLIPTVDLQHFFGGYIAKLNLAKCLASAGMRVRLVTVDPVGPLPPNWRQAIEAYSGLDGLFDVVEVEFGRGPAPVEVNPEDGFIATTWWSAHIAAAAVQALEGSRFVYLIQEFEPFTFPMGSYAALASESYRLPHFALFSSELLRDYFRRHQLGVYAHGFQAGDGDSVAFQNAITPVAAPTAAELAARPVRRLLFYARPEPHAARNMFELGALALERALEQGMFRDGWELHGIGTVRGQQRLALGQGSSLELLPRSDQAGYAAILRERDVGLALMYTPHPSLVPIEMASAGMLAVTNSFENKTAAELSAISPNLITAEPSIDGVVAGLRQALARVDDYESRVAGAAVQWSRDWSEAFDQPLIQRVISALGTLAPAA